MDLEERFAWALQVKQKNYGKLVQLQKRLFDEWALERLKENGFPTFKMSYMMFLMNIDEQGLTNKELSRKVHVSKQAMSKSMKEIERLGLVESKPFEGDARMSIISLTEKGKRMIVTVAEYIYEKTKEYEALVGKDDFKQAVDTMFKIVEYEKQKLEKRKFG